MATAQDEYPVKEIEVLLISAQDLKNVKHFSKMRTYAVVYVEKDFHTAETRIDEEGGPNPKWNEILKVKFHEKLLEDSNTTSALNIDIYAHGLVREKLVGSAKVLLNDVLKDIVEEEEEDPTRCLTVSVWKASGKPRGFLNLWVPPTGRFRNRRENLVYSVRDEEVEEVVEVVAVEEGGGMSREKMEEKLGEPIVLLDSRARSAPDLTVLGASLGRNASV